MDIKNQVCIYDNKTPATHLCSACGAPLCGSCGFTYIGEQFCNKCFDNIDEQDQGVCKACGSDMEAIMENNGFTEPAGPSHWEVSGYKLCPCRKGDE